MKKRNWLMTIAFAVLSLTIISTCVIGSTYAKFVSNVGANAGAKAAGFNVSGGESSTVTINQDTVTIGPAESATSAISFTYFSQVETEFVAADGTGVTITGTGVFADFEALKTGFAEWLTAKQDGGEFTDVEATIADSKTLEDMFEVTFTSDDAGETPIAGASMAEAFAQAVRTAGSLGGTGAKVDAMADTATTALTINDSFYAKITWVSTHSNDDNAWDTYVGEKVEEQIVAGTWSGIQVSLAITAQQAIA